jgi:hypothetical protein
VTSGQKTSIALCEQIHTVDHSRFGAKVGEAKKNEMKEIEEALCLSLGLTPAGKNYNGMFRKWEHYIKEYHLQVQQEQEMLKNATTTKAVETLRNQLTIVTKERNAYRELLDARNMAIDTIKNTKNPAV